MFCLPSYVILTLLMSFGVVIGLSAPDEKDNIVVVRKVGQ